MRGGCSRSSGTDRPASRAMLGRAISAPAELSVHGGGLRGHFARCVFRGGDPIHSRPGAAILAHRFQQCSYCFGHARRCRAALPAANRRISGAEFPPGVPPLSLPVA